MILNMDCRDGLRMLPENSVDSIVTDPPYGLGFMGQDWDHGVPSAEVWRECLRVLKPGGHLLAFAGTRTQHRMACNIEDAGFDIRDLIAWMYSQGFPKSMNVAAAIDRARTEDIEPVRAICRIVRAAMDRHGIKSRDLVPFFGNCHPRLVDHWAARDTDSQPSLPTWDQWQTLRDLLQIGHACDAEVWRLNNRKGEPGDAFQSAEVVAIKEGAASNWRQGEDGLTATFVDREVKAPNSADAEAWEGWGTSLKPAFEPITVARKPFPGTVAENVVQWGAGAINVDACKVGERFPSNLIHDGSADVLALFPESAGSGGSVPNVKITGYGDGIGKGVADYLGGERRKVDAGSGSAARFFYCAKASRRDRDEGLDAEADRILARLCQAQAEAKRGNTVDKAAGAFNVARVRKNNHPTVKPTDLMRYLCRLVTRPGGLVVDPFAGSGSTGKAAILEGFEFVGFELEAEFCAIGNARIEAARK